MLNHYQPPPVVLKQDGHLLALSGTCWSGEISRWVRLLHVLNSCRLVIRKDKSWWDVHRKRVVNRRQRGKDLSAVVTQLCEILFFKQVICLCSDTGKTNRKTRCSHHSLHWNKSNCGCWLGECNSALDKNFQYFNEIKLDRGDTGGGGIWKGKYQRGSHSYWNNFAHLTYIICISKTTWQTEFAVHLTAAVLLCSCLPPS